MESLKNLYRNLREKYRFFTSVNWIKTYYFNYKMFPKEVARKLPVYFYGPVKFSSLKGEVKIEAPIKRAMVGFGQPYEIITKNKGTSELFLDGTFVVKGHIQFGKDYFVYIYKNAYCEFGHMASLASSGKIICKNKIVLGTFARIGSESQLIDTNFHQMINSDTGEKYPMNGSIHLGDYNFISNRVSIMQKTKTPNNCTIASNTLCNKDYSNFGEYILIGGIPAKLLKKNITRDWEGEFDTLKKYLIIN
ncbi:MAG: transferase [Aequorivita sp.]|nr:MAG: transferase [Aequorivita sp.]